MFCWLWPGRYPKGLFLSESLPGNGRTWLLLGSRASAIECIAVLACVSGRATLLNWCFCDDDVEDQVHGWLLGLYLIGVFLQTSTNIRMPSWSLMEVEQSVSCYVTWTFQWIIFLCIYPLDLERLHPHQLHSVFRTLNFQAPFRACTVLWVKE